MLKLIQEMKFFLCTAFGDSIEFAGSMIDIKHKAVVRGAVLPLWGGLW
jgi:hypothetical protein